MSSWTEQDGGTLDLYNIDGKQIGCKIITGCRIAYIFYLVSSWTEKDGGTLDLYNIDGKLIGSLVVNS